MVEKLRTILGDDLFCEEDTSLGGALGKILLDKGLSVATAESCTGGNIAHEITLIAGSSAYFNGSVVAYSNDVKHRVLGVPQEMLDTHGAVSQPVVEAMALGACCMAGTTCAIATSGIAGPGGATPDKPVGTVWMAVCCGDKVVSECGYFTGTRAFIIERATQRAIMMLVDLLLSRD